MFLLPCMLAACAGRAGSVQAGNGEGRDDNPAPVAVSIPAAISPLAPAGDIAQSRFGMRALSYLGQNSARYGIEEASSELVYLNESVDALKQKHVRFQQVTKGIPVWGRQLIVHFDEGDEAVGITGSFLSGLGHVDVLPLVTAETAAATAVSIKGEGWRAAGGTLYVYLHEFQPKLVHLVTLVRGLERWFVFVDAHDGAVLHQMTGMPAALP